jgi:hypothetical protein
MEQINWKNRPKDPAWAGEIARSLEFLRPKPNSDAHLKI